jgi:hypothetical protein
VVSAQTGSVLLVRVDDPDPIAARWYARFESLFRTRAAVRPDLLAALPPATDGALTQAQVFAQFGQRNDAQFRPREFPRSDGGDSTLVDGCAALLALPRRGAEPVLAWTVPLLERSTLRVAGLVVALGGREPRVLWQPSVPDGAALDRGGRAAGPRIRQRRARRVRERPAAGQRPRARVPDGERIRLRAAVLSVRGDNVPAFSFVALLAGDTLTAGESVSAAAGALLPDSGVRAGRATSARASTRSTRRCARPSAAATGPPSAPRSTPSARCSAGRGTEPSERRRRRAGCTTAR